MLYSNKTPALYNDVGVFIRIFYLFHIKADENNLNIRLNESRIYTKLLQKYQRVNKGKIMMITFGRDHTSLSGFSNDRRTATPMKSKRTDKDYDSQCAKDRTRAC